MTKPNSITQDLDTKEAEATNPLVRLYIREIRKQAAAINPNCEASSDAFKEAVNSAQEAAQLESMRRAGIVIPSPDGQVTHDTWREHQAAPVVAVGALGRTMKVWTPERIEAARAMRDELRGQGNKAFAANTAAKFGVSATRLRDVLNDKPKKAPGKNAKEGWTSDHLKGLRQRS